MAAYFDNSSTYLKSYGTSTYFDGNKLNSDYAAYWDKYEVDSNEIGDSGKTIWNNQSEDGNKDVYKLAKQRVNLMKNIKGDAMYEVINTFSYYGWYGNTYTVNNSDGTQTNYEEYEYHNWFTGSEDENGNIDTGDKKLWKYGTTFYNNDLALIGGHYRPFLLRGGYWDGGAYAGVFASGGYYGSSGGNARFPSGLGVVAL